jgi:hypothetical protein
MLPLPAGRKASAGHMLFLDGVYFDSANRSSPRFRWVKAPTSAELNHLTHTTPSYRTAYGTVQGRRRRIRSPTRLTSSSPIARTSTFMLPTPAPGPKTNGVSITTAKGVSLARCWQAWSTMSMHTISYVVRLGSWLMYWPRYNASAAGRADSRRNLCSVGVNRLGTAQVRAVWVEQRCLWAERRKRNVAVTCRYAVTTTFPRACPVSMCASAAGVSASNKVLPMTGRSLPDSTSSLRKTRSA